MDLPINHDNERLATAALDGQSIIFDELYAPNKIIRYKRNRVREHLMKYLNPGSRYS